MVLFTAACGLAQTPAPKGAVQAGDRGAGCAYDWPKEEVDWIIPDDERAAYYALKSDADREEFITMFWMMRDPSPDSYNNELRNEFYRRVLYANEHFSTKDQDGARSDPGRVYIRYGPPQIAACAMESGLPALVWKYRWLDDWSGYHPFPNPEGVELRFVDTCRCGKYELQMSDDQKRQLFDQSKAYPHVVEEMHGPARFWPHNPPKTRYKDLELLLESHASRAEIPFELTTETKDVTRRTKLISLAFTFAGWEVEWRDEYAQMRMYGRLTDRKGDLVEILEGESGFHRPAIPVVPPSQISFTESIYTYGGSYHLEVIIQDVHSGKTSIASRDFAISSSAPCR